MRARHCGWLAGLLPLAACGAAVTAGAYEFDLSAFEPKRFTVGGYAELQATHFDLNPDGAFYLLRHHSRPRSSLDRLSPAVQVEGTFREGIAAVQAKALASASWDAADSHRQLTLMEGFLSLTPSPRQSFDVGKKVFRWGSGYAFNPVGFVDRPKDPDNPEEAREGFIAAGLDFTRSGSGNLRTTSFNLVALPVAKHVNEDFGERDHLNVAARLYWLYRDTDIYLMGLAGGSRPNRFGLALARNLQTNFAVHAELAHVPRQQFRVLQDDGSLAAFTGSGTSWLLGLRYLTAQQLTVIVEAFHNGTGFREDELERFFSRVHAAHDAFLATGSTAGLDQAASLARLYGRPQAGRNYLYARLSWKEPADILYFTPAFTVIANLDDRSASLSPEATYTRFTNWEARIRLAVLTGGRTSEYGEKANRWRLELRLRHHF